MTPQRAPSPFVNTADPRQDVHRVREHDPNQARYGAAEKLLPRAPPGQCPRARRRNRRLRGAAEGRGYDVAFADLSESNLATRGRARVSRPTGSISTFRCRSRTRSFDGVTMLEVIEHIVAAEQLLGEVARVLKPGGFVILSTPNFSFLHEPATDPARRLSADEGYHYRFFNPRVLESRLRDAGLVVGRVRAPRARVRAQHRPQQAAGASASARERSAGLAPALRAHAARASAEAGELARGRMRAAGSSSARSARDELQELIARARHV